MPAPATPTLGVVDGLAQLSFTVQARIAAHAAAADLSLVQLRLLGVLRDRHPTMNELAALLGLDKSSASGLVDRAQRRGLVVREPSPRDGRSVLVGLTATGQTLAAQVADRFAADVEELLAPLSARERATLDRLMSRVLVADAAAQDVNLFAAGSRP